MIVIEAGLLGVVSQALGPVPGLALSLILIYVDQRAELRLDDSIPCAGAFLLQALLACWPRPHWPALYPAAWRPGSGRPERSTPNDWLRLQPLSPYRCLAAHRFLAWPVGPGGARWEERRPATLSRCRATTSAIRPTNRVVVLHRERRDRSRTALRLSGHVLPGRHRPAPVKPSNGASAICSWPTSP